MQISPERLKKDVYTLSEDLVPRDAAHTGNLDRTASFIHDSFEPHAVGVRDQSYSTGNMTVRNVCACFGPETRDRIVVGAHYDVAGPFPGADDNASGVAGLLELGRLLSHENLTTRVELVSYPLEEPPFFNTKKMGSYVHAFSLKERDISVKAMLALEMIGYFSDKPDSQRYPLFLLRPFYPSKGNFIAVAGNLFQRRIVRTVREAMKTASPLPVESINAPKILPGIAFSDHLNYWKAGYRAVMITDTAFYRNPHYHTVFDRPDTLDYKRMAQVVTGVLSAVKAVSDNR